ncbi:MAG: hypothetical protein M5U19_00685 [Microthrixaceae bacterium]|nr:hypothetical protein [Microthrixaceae bacterium]
MVDVVYGAVWADAAAPLRWLLIVGGLRVLLQLAGEIIAVVDRTMVVLRLRFLWLLLLPLALDYGAEHMGLSGVGIAHVLVALVIMSPLFLREVRRSGIPLKPLGGTLPRPAVAGALAFVAMVLLSPLVESGIMRILVLGTVGSLVYVSALVPANPVVTRTWQQLRGVGEVAV